jgi:autotransporter-associated beta strand protein
MRPVSSYMLAKAVTLATLGITASLSAQTIRFYDVDGATPGWGSPNGSSWDATAGAFWSTDASGSTAGVVWPNPASPGDIMSFGSSSTPFQFDSTQTITINNPINASGLDAWLARSAGNFGQPLRLTGADINAGTATFLVRPQVGGGTNAAAQNFRIDNVITGSGGLTLDTTVGTRNTTAELRLAGANTYTGVTNVWDSTLSAYNDTALGASGAGNGTILNNANARLLIGGLNGTSTPIAVVEDVEMKAVNSSAIRCSNANNTLTGNILYSVTSSDGGINVNTNHVFTLNGTIKTANSPATQRRIVLSASGGTTSAIIVNSVISDGDDGTLTRLLIDGISSGASGTIELTGANTFSGQVNIRRGTLLLSNATALGAEIPSNVITLGDGGLNDTNNTLRLLVNGPYDVVRAVQINVPASAFFNAVLGGTTAHVSNFKYAVGLNFAAANIELTAAAGGRVNFNDILDENNTTGLGTQLKKVGDGTVAFNNPAGNDFSGGLLVQKGTLLANNTTGSATGTSNVTVNNDATVGGTGIISGSVTLNSTARVSPGDNSRSTLTVGSLSMSSTANFDVELESSVLFDQLVVSGAASVGGSLNVSLVSPFEPAHTDSFTVLTSTARTGSFTNLNAWGLIDIAPGKAILPTYTATSVILTEFTKVGDVDFSGVINNQDIAPFVAALTGPALLPPSSLGFAADINGDGVVNNQDIAPFVALLTGSRPLSEFANDPDFAPLIALVPEPTSLSLLALGGLALRRRRQR